MLLPITSSLFLTHQINVEAALSLSEHFGDILSSHGQAVSLKFGKCTFCPFLESSVITAYLQCKTHPGKVGWYSAQIHLVVYTELTASKLSASC